MKKPPVVLILLVASTLGAPAPAPACLSFPTVWRLAADAELIVLARVESIEIAAPLDESDIHGSFEGDVAVLRVLETWKGPSRAEIRVQFRESAYLSYREGEVVVAFLQSGESRAAADAAAWAEAPDPAEWLDDGGDPEELRAIQEAVVRMREEARAYAPWSTGRWFFLGPVSDEVERPAESQISGLRSLIELALRLQRDGGTDGADGVSPREWLLAAAELSSTRREAVYPLLWMAKGPAPYVRERNGDEEEQEEPDAANAPLAKEELARLAAAFVREPSVGETDVAMLKLLAPYPDLDVDRTAAAVVEAGLLLRPIPGWVTAMVEEALRRYGDDFGARIGRDDVDPRGRPIFTGPGENTLGTIWAVARRELGIPEAAPAQAPERREGPEGASAE